MASNVCLITFTVVTIISFAAIATCSARTTLASAVFGDQKDPKVRKGSRESKGLWGHREKRGPEVYKGNQER